MSSGRDDAFWTASPLLLGESRYPIALDGGFGLLIFLAVAHRCENKHKDHDYERQHLKVGHHDRLFDKGGQKPSAIVFLPLGSHGLHL